MSNKPIKCEVCTNESVMPCFDRDEDGEYQDSVVSYWLCEEHARERGYCVWCGQSDPSAKANPSGFCDECQIDAIRDENYGDDDGY